VLNQESRQITVTKDRSGHTLVEMLKCICFSDYSWSIRHIDPSNAWSHDFGSQRLSFNVNLLLPLAVRLGLLCVL